MKNQRILSVVFLAIILIGFLSSSFAASNDALNLENSNNEEEQLSREFDFGKLLLRYIFSVIGILVLTVLGVRYLVKKFTPSDTSGDWVQVLGRTYLGSNKDLVLVEIEGKGYVLGVTDNNINVITVIEEEKRMDELRGLSLENDQAKSLPINFMKKNSKIDFHKTMEGYIKQTRNLYPRNEDDKKL